MFPKNMSYKREFEFQKCDIGKLNLGIPQVSEIFKDLKKRKKNRFRKSKELV